MCRVIADGVIEGRGGAQGTAEVPAVLSSEAPVPAVVTAETPTADETCIEPTPAADLEGVAEAAAEQAPEAPAAE
jgi:hypothetical protein